jgi:Protein of unknown function (DUF3987)
MSHKPANLHPFDAWVLGLALAGQIVGNHALNVSLPNRQLAIRLTNASVEERKQIWDDHLDTLDPEEADAWIEAVAAVNPNESAPAEDDSWGQPFAFKLPPVEPFPVDVYPVLVRRLIEQGAIAVGCPPDFFAMPVLVVAGAAIGRSMSLLLKDDYFASGSIYAISIGLAGDGKSPALGKVVKPLDRIDQGYLDEWRTEMTEYEERLGEFETASRSTRFSRSATRQAMKGAGRRKRSDADDFDSQDDSSDGTQDEQSSSSEALDLGPVKPEKPTLQRNVVRDTTTEALDVIMSENPRGLILVQDEASSLVTSMNQSRGGKGSDRQWYLSTWSGQSRTVDRKQNQDRIPIRVLDPFLCLVGGMVPANLGMLGDGQGLYDGFLDRFLFGFPAPCPRVDGGTRASHRRSPRAGNRSSSGFALCPWSSARLTLSRTSSGLLWRRSNSGGNSLTPITPSSRVPTLPNL